jgi:hypothetical protein
LNFKERVLKREYNTSFVGRIAKLEGFTQEEMAKKWDTLMLLWSHFQRNKITFC